MKIPSLFSMLANILVKDEVVQISLQEKLMRPLSSDEMVAVAGGPDVDNDPPPA